MSGRGRRKNRRRQGTWREKLELKMTCLDLHRGNAWYLLLSNQTTSNYLYKKSSHIRWVIRKKRGKETGPTWGLKKSLSRGLSYNIGTAGPDEGGAVGTLLGRTTHGEGGTTLGGGGEVNTDSCEKRSGERTLPFVGGGTNPSKYDKRRPHSIIREGIFALEGDCQKGKIIAGKKRD